MTWDVGRGRRFCRDVIRKIDPSYTVGWSLAHRGDRTEPTWPGDGRLLMSEADLVRSLHDLAHLIVAPRSRHVLPEFGLGPDPANYQEVGRRVSLEAAQREEDLACAAQWMLAAYLEGRAGVDEVESHVNALVPPYRSVVAFTNRYACLLPPDFGGRVLTVRAFRVAAE